MSGEEDAAYIHSMEEESAPASTVDKELEASQTKKRRQILKNAAAKRKLKKGSVIDGMPPALFHVTHNEITRVQEDEQDDD